ncbi:MAG: cell division protein FtsJ [Methanosarcinaceae archaeon]|nr:cell division protein FtsJ [Methanosarcinaceae archaeon]
MRLDIYLVELGFVKSRGRAKDAIEKGNVSVNGTVCTKPSKNVDTSDVIEIAEGQDKPKGYFKLEYICEKYPLFKSDSFVLDLGSSAGGYVSYVLEILNNSGHVTGIEFSKDFRSELGKLSFENENFDIIFDDVFTIDLSNLSFSPYDTILNDMTLEPKDSISALIRISPVLKPGGHFLQVIKTNRPLVPKSLISMLNEADLQVEDVIETPFGKKELYIVGKKLEKV